MYESYPPFWWHNPAGAKNLPPPESVTQLDAMIDAGLAEAEDITDDDIINLLAADFGMTRAQVIQRLAGMDLAKLAAGEVAA